MLQVFCKLVVFSVVVGVFSSPSLLWSQVIMRLTPESSDYLDLRGRVIDLIHLQSVSLGVNPLLIDPDLRSDGVLEKTIEAIEKVAERNYTIATDAVISEIWKRRLFAEYEYPLFVKAIEGDTDSEVKVRQHLNRYYRDLIDIEEYMSQHLEPTFLGMRREVHRGLPSAIHRLRTSIFDLSDAHKENYKNYVRTSVFSRLSDPRGKDGFNRLREFYFFGSQSLAQKSLNKFFSLEELEQLGWMEFVVEDSCVDALSKVPQGKEPPKKP